MTPPLTADSAVPTDSPRANDPLGAQRRLIAALSDPARHAHYPHPVDSISVIETHISFVILTGPFAYKIKKAVNLGFLDYTSLAQRRFFCHEELRLNRRLAPELYLEVVPLGGTPDEPRWGGDGKTIEYAVKMHEFAQENLLDQRLERDDVPQQLLDDLAAALADFHARTPVAAATQAYGSGPAIASLLDANLSHLRAVAGSIAGPTLDALEAWLTAECRRLQPVFARRKAEGNVRECHGDLHLSNIALHDGRLQVFDGIEFNPDLRWIDVVHDVAFLFMDLVQASRPDVAWRLLNIWLEITGDYAGLEVLRFYAVNRAMVRALVSRLHAVEAERPADEREAAGRAAERYLGHALTLIAPRPPALLLTHGFAGAGKTTLAQRVAEQYGYIRLRSDVERKRLQGLPPLARAAGAARDELYSEAATAATYEQLGRLAALAIGNGYPVVIDAACLRYWQRAQFRARARRCHIPFLILDLQAPLPLFEERLASRAENGNDASDATVDVLAKQVQACDPLTAAERKVSFAIDAAADLTDALCAIELRLAKTAARRSVKRS